MSGQQEPKPVQVMDFTVVSSSPLKILLEDGTRISVQLVPVRITRMDGVLPDGQPMHQFQMQQIIDQLPPDGRMLPEALKGKV